LQRGGGFAGVLVSLFVGATTGGLLLVHAHIYAPVLPFVVTVVAVATAAIVFGGATREMNGICQAEMTELQIGA
jgi:hypothetical protein